MMRNLIVSSLPLPVLNMLRDLKGRARLMTAAGETVDPSGLRRADTLDLPAMLSDGGIESAWREDYAAIASAIGDKNLMGGVNPGDRRALYFMVNALRPASVLEVGTHIAASSLFIAAALKRSGGGRLTTVDIVDVNAPGAPWRDAGYARPPAAFAKELGLLDHIDFVQSPAVDFMRGAERSFDLIFLDGDHDAKSVYLELSAAASRLRNGGIILLHDYYPDARPLWSDGNVISGPFRALERVARENGRITVTPLGELPWPTKLGSRRTSLALVASR